MKLSPLQLVRYVVTDIACSANLQYNPEKDWEDALSQYSINTKATPLPPQEGDPRPSWSVELEVNQNIAEGKNLPYRFRIVIVGIFTWQNGAAEDPEKRTQFVQVNGSSILYAMAREQLRNLTASGAWGSILLPTLSFYEKPQTSNEPGPTET